MPELSEEQIAHYCDEGYLILPGVLSSSEVADLVQIVTEQTKTNPYPEYLRYPEPAKYTVSGNFLAIPGLAGIAEHPQIVAAAEALLGQRAYLTAYVAYLRTPGHRGSKAHCDYKRWRPVGSSMNWLFAIVPLVDFDKEHGPFLVSPRSHRLPKKINADGPIRDLTKPDPEQLPPFIDPELRAGDLLLANEHTWHEAPPGTTSSDDRIGIFNKYCAVDAPPAVGYYPYNANAFNALSDNGQRLIPVCFDKPLTMTRLLIERSVTTDPEYMILGDESNGTVKLPGGVGWEEEEVGWDVGARVGSLQDLVREQLGLDITWMSYLEDVEEGDGICRLYAYSGELPQDPTELLKRQRHNWFTKDQLLHTLGEDNSISRAVLTWQRDDLIRGKGVAIRQRERQFE